jgi:hypothetical protein
MSLSAALRENGKLVVNNDAGCQMVSTTRMSIKNAKSPTFNEQNL